MGEDGPIKVERYVWIARESSCVVAKPAYTVYLRVPPDVQEALRERYNIDLRREAKRVAVETSLTEERGEDGHRSVVIEHKIRMLPGVA